MRANTVVGDGLDLPEDLLDEDDDLMTAKDIAHSLGLTRKYITDHVSKMPGFPKPWLRLTRKTILWRRVEVERWVRLRQRRRR